MTILRTVSDHIVETTFRAGSMAQIWTVRAPSGEARLLKRPQLGFGHDPACYAGFEVEQMIYARVTGPHVAACFAQGEDDTGPFIILEHVAGTSLEEVALQAPLPVARIVVLGIQLANALQALHRQNVVHHDLTPGHVLLHPEGRVVLIDFGLACHGDLPDLAAAESSVPMGTPAIIAPEQLLGVRGDPRSDLYAAGAILYLLATGRYPFGLATNTWDMQRRRWFDTVAPGKLRPDLPAWLADIILRCLAVRPDRRYSSAAQLAHDLAHPDQVVISQRGQYTLPGRLSLAFQRWWSERRLDVSLPRQARHQLERAPHVLVAIDTEHHDEALAEKIRMAVRRLIAHDPHWRVTCLGVLEPSLITEQEEASEIARSMHTGRLAALHHWARPLQIPQERIRFHVLTGHDAATCLIDYATSQYADHIVMGARGNSSLRRLLGSVSARVATEAPCSVTVVRV